MPSKYINILQSCKQAPDQKLIPGLLGKELSMCSNNATCISMTLFWGLCRPLLRTRRCLLQATFPNVNRCCSGPGIQQAGSRP